MDVSLTRLKQSQLLWVVGSLLWFFIGALSGPFFDWIGEISNFFEKEGVIFMLFWPFALQLALLLIVISVFAHQAEKREDTWNETINEREDTWNETINEREDTWNETINEIEKHIGTPAELIFEPLEKSRGSFYHQLTKYVQEATSEDDILLMDYYPSKKGFEDPNETNFHKQAREGYIKALEEKAAEPETIYRRIICFDDGPDSGKIQAGNVEEWKVDHCNKMLEIQSDKPDKISITKYGTTFCSDMLIIGRKKAVISIDIHDYETGLVHTDGALIFFNPPNGQIINRLVEFFWKAQNNSVSVKSVPEK